MAGNNLKQTIASTGTGAAVALQCKHPDNRGTVLVISAPAGSSFLVQTSPDFAFNSTPSWNPQSVFDPNQMLWTIGSTPFTPPSYPYAYDVDMANRQAFRVYANSLPGGGSAVVSLFTDNYYTSSPPLPGPQGPSGPAGPAGPSGVSGPSGPSGPTGS
jgi:hypothetical protein